jgi:RNA polymerase sigma-70 factor (ECF subfamily)
MARGTNEVDWEAAYWELTPRLYNFFRYRLAGARASDDQTAQDLTAQVMLRAWRYRARYAHDLGAFEGWAFGIARNVFHDHLRAQVIELSLDAVLELADDESVEAEIEGQRDAEHLAALLARLPAREQELVALKYGAGLTNRAIAAALNLSESNVGSLLHRIVRKLRAAWEEAHEPER